MHAVVNVDLLMDGWDHFALWVGVFAALVGAAAAFAAWRTVVVSERQQAADRAERRIAQALLVYAELVIDVGPQVYLTVTNASAYPVSGVGGSWRRGDKTVSTIGGSRLIPGGESLRLTPEIDTFTALYEDARYEIHFTDVAGVRWNRLDMDRPEEEGFPQPVP